MAILVFGLLLPCGLWAKEADSVAVKAACSDSVAVADYNPNQGLAFKVIGLGVAGGGVAFMLGSAALTGGLAVATLPAISSTFADGGLSTIFSIFLGALVLEAVGEAFALSAFVGGTAVAIGAPFYAAGAAVGNCNGNWRTVRYSGPEQSGFSVLMDASSNFKYGQIYLTPGYHINQRIFAGAGIAPALCWDSEQQLEKRWLLPVYGHARYTFTDNVIAPYIGVSPGYDFVQKNFYGSAEAGLRFRVNANSPESFWVALNGTTDGNFKQLGYKLGWSF